MVEIIEKIKLNQKYLKYLRENYEGHISLVEDDADKEKRILEITKEYEFNKKTIHEILENCCNHDIFIKVHGSMITGKTSQYLPNENHICYYCLICGKYHKEDELPENAMVLDFFRHEDALLVGYNNSLALVDYFQDLAVKCHNKSKSYTDEGFIDMVNSKKEEIKVPEKYIKRK